VTRQFCVKASTGNSGLQTGSSYTVEWTNNGGQTPDISYVVVYGPGEEDPCYWDPELPECSGSS
jgi:hypothetical protein